MRRRDFCCLTLGALAIFPPLTTQAMRLGKSPMSGLHTIPVQGEERERRERCERIEREERETRERLDRAGGEERGRLERRLGELREERERCGR